MTPHTPMQRLPRRRRVVGVPCLLGPLPSGSDPATTAAMVASIGPPPADRPGLLVVAAAVAAAVVVVVAVVMVVVERHSERARAR